MKWSVTSASLALFAATTSCWPYDESLVQYNLNEKKSATNPADYWGEWPHHTFHPSPDNWRFPIYTIFLDRFVNGDPTNDNINGSYYEHDLRSTQMRHGGDVSGLLDTLDYLQGMGIKGIFLAGTVLMNQPWGYDGYSALDTTLLDQHYGNITTWRNAITEIHNRGMYVLFDNTISTLGDLLGFIPHMNDSAPFTVDEYPVKWKSNRRYADFDFSNEYNKTCNYPRFWNETGYPIHESTAKSLVGCYNSDFDQYGDVEAFGVFPDWQRELAKFASVQDRLREWIPSVRERLIRHSCIIIASLDIDGFRYDKAIQSTVDALGDMSAAYRDCARKHGKKNFFIPGEITGGNTFGSVYLGRGRQPDMVPDNITQAVKLTNESDSEYFIRKEGHQALDASAFHYSIYRSLTRFLGLSGNLEAGWDLPVKWTDAWNEMLTTNDLVNANTGKFDFRHMYGVSNQDVFRWPSIQYGVQRQLLGLYITTLHLPGIPMLLWGEEQAFNILDSTSENYIYGRQSMSPATAWMTHGCYKLGSSQYVDWPIESGREACKDPTQAYDHRDPSHPVRNIIKHMYQMRANYPSMNEGWWIQLLSNQTENVYYPGSRGIPTETGMWSILRGRKQDMQDLGSVHNNQSVWLVYQNVNRTVTYDFNCSDPEHALVAPFGTGTTVKNLFYPHDEHKLINTTLKLGIDNSMDHNGCLGRLEMQPFDFRAYVPKKVWKAPRPMITKFTPGHDAPMLSTVAPNAQENVDVALYFSTEMDCDSVTKSIHLNSSTESGKSPTVDSKSVSCKKVSPNKTKFVGEIPGVWAWSAKLTGVYNGVHRLTVNNASGILRGSKTDAVDHFLFRIGQKDNPMVFTSANYSANLLQQDSSGKLYIRHHAAGADLYRYSTNWGSSFSKWFSYKGGNDSIDELPWSGTAQQGWDGKHVTVEYWSKLTGSSDYVQDGDLAWESKPPRRFPHMFFNGPYNEYGFDSGIENEFKQERNGTWRYRLMTEWPARGQINVWGMNPDGQPDKTGVYGDIDGDNILDRMPPSSLTPTLLNISDAPPQPYLAWDILVNDANMEYAVHPSGDQKLQIVLYILLWVVPIVTASVVVYTFMKSFYQVKVNVVGVSEKKSIIPLALRKKFGKNNPEDEAMNPLIRFANRSGLFRSTSTVTTNNDRRRMILIATMEYDIEDWGIKIKIGGLGVMAQLMGKNLGHQDLIWVVPCIGGVEYPRDQPSESMFVTVLGNSYEVKVQYHVLRNITYVLLDAPVFRQQTKSEPYPSRMDDLNSAIYYSAWNQCIAQALKRFPVDLYHINDYHGSLAPLYLLPQTIPCCLSLHNADFQGLWPIRTQKEKGEVCSVFNLDVGIASRYIQFGDVFNLLHAGASYLRVHQQGFGAVGVSKKYGKRSYARYPIFWGLRKVGNLPNPDPSDTGEWNREQAAQGDASIDVEYERSRGELKRQAQEWAGLSQNPDADLLVFVGRWSMQKGVDLIADVMPAVLESRPKVQLICVGPIIDLYGKFAALKLERMMQLYPGRVFSKPEFTALPPYIFSGAEFALIPSRDEPFGLVAVEFGRKGALGIGARVGGLGQMPGWWYNVESTTTSHLLQQFKVAIKCALNSKSTTRAMMRARSAKQRFPVAQWVEDLQILQSTSIRVHTKEMAKSSNQSMVSSNTSTPIGMQTPPVGTWTPPGMRTPPNLHSRESSLTNSNRLSALDPQQRNTIVYSRDPSPGEQQEPRPGLAQQLSLGIRSGPGHLDEHRGRQNARIGETSNPNDNNIGIAVTDPAGHTADTEEVDDVIRNYYTNEVYSLTPEQAEEERRMGASRHIGPHSRDSSFSSTESGTPGTRGGQFAESGNPMNNASAALSVNLVIGEKKDFKLQQVDPFFTDSSGECYRDFERKLRNLKGANSESRLCIEEFLEKSEKKWFDRFRNARLGRNHSPDRMKRGPSPVNWYTEDSTSSGSGSERNKEADEFLLGDDYVPPSGLRKWMQVRIWDWPIYSLFLALGQIIAANSYQITLLTGQVGETADKLYGIATVYLISSIVWWFFFRWFKSVYVLSIPWFFYGIAFLIIGLAHFEPDYFSRGWIQNVGSGAYAAASSSGSVFFALNFGDENSAPTKQWVLRACIIQGTQQAYVIGLWYWGSVLTQQTTSGTPSSQSTITNTWKITAICTPIAVFLWIVGLLVFFGLPNKYRQTPGKVPSFYKSAFRRKIVLWNFVVVIIQNFFMSAPYGRNWRFLWSTKNAATWQIGILVVVFFGFVWAGMLFILRALSRRHSWILPVFACGLGAPRWAQIWWATSNSGLNLTWTGGYLAGALASRSLWLWLGVLDAIQGVGFGMILLQTLTRIHICFALLASQVVGSVATICARAFGPNKTGPGGISPDISLGYSVLGNAWFWIALFFQLLVCAGFLLFYRREQLTKP